MPTPGRFGGMEQAVLRHETYARSNKRLTYAVMVLSAACVISVAIAFTVTMSKPEPRYFATRTDGQLLPLIAVSTPFLTDGQITSFAVEAVTKSLTIDFANWRQDLTEAAIYFERSGGWEAFLDAIQSSGMLSYVRERRLVSTVVANGATIVRSGLDEQRRYSWVVQVPLTITYESATEISRDTLLAELEVARLPTWEAPSAVGISRIVVKPARAETLD